MSGAITQLKQIVRERSTSFEAERLSSKQLAEAIAADQAAIDAYTTLLNATNVMVSLDRSNLIEELEIQVDLIDQQIRRSANLAALRGSDIRRAILNGLPPFDPGFGRELSTKK